MNQNEAKALSLVAVSRIQAKTAADDSVRHDVAQKFMNDDEIENIFLALLRVRGARGVSEDELLKVINECAATRFMSACVDLAAKGLLDVEFMPDLPEGEQVVFRARSDIDSQVRDVLNARRAEGGS